MLHIGNQAPEFSLLTDNNEKVSLKALRGKKIVLYFYPKDDTPGCTQEACDFRDRFTQFSQENTIILGISKDSPEKHKIFKLKYALPFTLLSDPDAAVCEAYGVINPKNFFGKTFLGIQRSTFLIDEQGLIQGIWRKVKVRQHAQTVFDHLSS